MAMDELFSVKDLVVLVSGGSRGIGRAIAAGFAERDAKVVITGRQEATLGATAREIFTGRHPVEFLVSDVAEAEKAGEVVEQAVAKFGRVDSLINVAGVNKRKRAETYTVEEYDFILNINLRGAFFLSQAVGKHMIERKGGGTIINIESLNTVAPLRGVLPYAMSKAGMGMMTQGLAMEWGPHDIRVNSLAPGFILTDLTNKLWSQPHMQAWGIPNTPLRRLGVPEDMIGTAVFLASPASAFLTGQTIYVDGGFTAGENWPIELP
jgi:NAD(P)-dependent dehydrogenase (short-subunit alcohol dehydrogenase family)